MEKQGEQIEMAFTRAYSIEEMGIVLAEKPPLAHLFSSFISRELNPPFASIFPSRLDREKITKVGCPFCKKGFLKLENVKPQYSGGPHPVPAVLHHVGNHYEYSCSNPECKGTFFGSITWMCID